jgi:hypothetical protein
LLLAQEVNKRMTGRAVTRKLKRIDRCWNICGLSKGDGEHRKRCQGGMGAPKHIRRAPKSWVIRCMKVLRVERGLLQIEGRRVR